MKWFLILITLFIFVSLWLLIYVTYKYFKNGIKPLDEKQEKLNKMLSNCETDLDDDVNLLINDLKKSTKRIKKKSKK